MAVKHRAYRGVKGRSCSREGQLGDDVQSRSLPGAFHLNCIAHILQGSEQPLRGDIVHFAERQATSTNRDSHIAECLFHGDRVYIAEEALD